MSVLYFVLCLSATLQPLLTSLVFVQKFKFILMKMHKNCCHQSCCFFWLRYAPNHLSASPQTPLGELTALPRLPSWFRGGVPEKGKEGGRGKRGGRESRNAQMQSWQAYTSCILISFLMSFLCCIVSHACPGNAKHLSLRLWISVIETVVNLLFRLRFLTLILKLICKKKSLLNSPVWKTNTIVSTWNTDCHMERSIAIVYILDYTAYDE